MRNEPARSAQGSLSERLTARHWIYFSLITLVLLCDGMDVTIVAHVFPTLIKSWGVSVGGGIAFVVAVGFLAMGLGAVVAGGSVRQVGTQVRPHRQRSDLRRGHRAGRNLGRLHGIRRLADPGLPGNGRRDGVRKHPAGGPDPGTAARGTARRVLRRGGAGDNRRCNSGRHLDSHRRMARALGGGRLDPVGGDRRCLPPWSPNPLHSFGQAPGERHRVAGRAGPYLPSSAQECAALGARGLVGVGSWPVRWHRRHCCCGFSDSSPWAPNC